MSVKVLVSALCVTLGIALPAAVWCQPPPVLAVWDHHGSYGLARPWGLSVDGAGNVYVVDGAWSRVFVFDSNGGALRSWATPLNSYNIATASAGLAYVTAPYPIGTPLTPVFVFGLDGDLVATWDSSGSAPGEFIHPVGVAVDEGGNVYISEQGNARVQVLTADGQPVTQWGSRGTGPGQFGDPEGIALGHDGLVYVTDADNQTIQVFTRGGTLVRMWGGELGAGPGQFHGLRGIALDALGNVYVADTGNARIQVFTAAGEYLTEWGAAGYAPGQFDHVMSVAIGSDGRIFVADTWNGRIQVFGPAPTPARPSSWGRLKAKYR